MEVLINIIIVLVIISSLFKRMREIAKKGDDARLPPAHRPGRMPPATENMDDQSEPSDAPVPEWSEPTGTPPTEVPPSPVFEEAGAPSLEDIFERMLRKTAHPEPVSPQPTHVRMPPPETAFPEFKGPLAVPVRTAPRPVRAGMQSRQATETGVGIAFAGSDVVRGMVMSEILGPPVALRG